MATYVTSPPTQSGVGNTRTSITRTLTLGSSQTHVDYEVSSESGFDFFRVYFAGVKVHEDSGTGVGLQTAIIPSAAGSTAVRLEYEKDGSDNAGDDRVKVTQIRTYTDYGDGPELDAYWDFEGTSGSGPPTNWTEILNDGGVAVTGSHWTFTDTAAGGVTGTIASTTTKPTAALVGNQTHVGTIAATTTKPTFAASGVQTHLGVLGATTTLPTFAGSGTVGSVSGVSGDIAATAGLPTFAATGTQTHVGALSAYAAAPTFAAAGIQTHLGALAATASMPGFFAEGTQAETIPPSAESVFLRNAGPSRAELSGGGFQARIEVDRGTSARIRPTTSYNAEFSEG